MEEATDLPIFHVRVNRQGRCFALSRMLASRLMKKKFRDGAGKGPKSDSKGKKGASNTAGQSERSGASRSSNEPAGAPSARKGRSQRVIKNARSLSDVLGLSKQPKAAGGERRKFKIAKRQVSESWRKQLAWSKERGI